MRQDRSHFLRARTSVTRPNVDYITPDSRRTTAAEECPLDGRILASDNQ